MSRTHSRGASPAELVSEIDTRWFAVFAVQALTLAAYASLSGTDITSVRYLVYPFVWMNVAAWAVLRVAPRSGPLRTRVLAAFVGTTYFAVLLYVAGFLGHGHASMTGLRVVSAAPGWGPMVAYQNAWIRLYVVPFQVIGYAALSYLLYATILDATRAAVSGTLGLVSCVGCAWTLVAPFIAGGSAVGAVLYNWSYDLTTVVFVLTVALLVRALDRQ
ncbi:DUF7546 family protein [Halobacterium zhouii]|uniref:DUF7546 family protein n=1 Tax=Halobacterium zhouii TaxID=2902624 RepID=UPI001E2B45C4|nr:hypothetical protein [Halobacterium zhouii]